MNWRLRLAMALGCLAMMAGVQAAGPDKPIRRCLGEGGAVVFTDRGDCPPLALERRLSVLPPPPPSPAPSSRAKPRDRSSGRTRRGGSGPRRTHGRDIPRECRWEWGRAQKVERLLRLGPRKGESRWTSNYCRWLCELHDAGCPVTDADFKQRRRCAPLSSRCAEWR